jgi:hypothetical protein
MHYGYWQVCSQTFSSPAAGVKLFIFIEISNLLIASSVFLRRPVAGLPEQPGKRLSIVVTFSPSLA